jgi:cell division septation protein DedD
LASHLQDDGFHEIQLNGKQLVFLFMAATVVSVVIFLCGVLVGRGVRTERAASAEIAAANAGDPLPQPAPAPAAPPTASTASGSDPRTAAAPPAPADDLSYFNRLEKSNAAQEDLKPKPAMPEKAAVQDKPAVQDKARSVATEKPSTPPPVSAPVAAPAPRPVAAERTATPPSPVAEAPAAKVDVPAAPGGSGFTVQVAALPMRTEADAIAKRLSDKGYAAYVLVGGGSQQVFRVRVGKFPTRREAESVATRLQKEEQFKPWITR